MGIHDRGYYRGDEWQNPGRSADRSPFAMGSVIKALIVVNVLVFVLDMFSGKSAVGGGALRLSQFLALKHGVESLPGPLENPLYLWQLLSYGFAHASISSPNGIFHVLFNCLVLFSLGRAVEERYGSAWLLRFYLMAVVFSGLVWLLIAWLTGASALMVGASGAVTGVVILFVLNFPRQTLLIMGIIPAPAWLVGLLCVLVDLSLAFSRETTIAAESHLAGAAFAALCFYGKWDPGSLNFAGIRKWFARKPRLKVHAPDDPALSDQADRILEKVHQQGQDSLTARERKILEEYSRRVRDSRH